MTASRSIPLSNCAPIFAGPNRRRNRRVSFLRSDEVPVYLGVEKAKGLVLDVSETGISVALKGLFRVTNAVSLELALPGATHPLEAHAQVIWGDTSGRIGLRFINVFSTSANYLEAFIKADSRDEFQLPAHRSSIEDQASKKSLPGRSEGHDRAVPSDHLDRIRKVSAIKDEVSNNNLDQSAALDLLAERTRVLSRATGVAIALGDKEQMTCRVSVGAAPEIGVPLRPGSGLGGECVRSGKVVRCADIKQDVRVDRNLSEQLPFRSTIMLPLGRGKDSLLGVLAVFSTEPGAFAALEEEILERLAEIITAVAVESKDLTGDLPAGSDLASATESPGVTDSGVTARLLSSEEGDSHTSNLRTLPRRHWLFRRSLWPRMTFALLVVFAVLGWWFAWNRIPRKNSVTTENYNDVDFLPPPAKAMQELMSTASAGDRDAEYALAMEYASGKRVAQNDVESSKWLLRAANQGHTSAQRMLGSYYLAGRGVPLDNIKAYQWFAIASSYGDEASKQRAELLAMMIGRPQLSKARREVSEWLRQRLARPNRNLSHLRKPERNLGKEIAQPPFATDGTPRAGAKN